MRQLEPDEYFDVWFDIVLFHVAWPNVWFDVQFVV